ncbi:MAG: hypothetical protein R3B96_21195 [Pirellulaceae bacterium]
MLKDQANNVTPEQLEPLWAGELVGMSQDRVSAWHRRSPSRVSRSWGIRSPLAEAASAWGDAPLVSDCPMKRISGVRRRSRQGRAAYSTGSSRRGELARTTRPLLERDVDGGWHAYSSGQAFDAEQQATAWRFDGQWTPVTTDVDDRMEHRAWGTVHSPEFTIDGDAIWYCIRGADVELRLVIDITRCIPSGLFSDLTKRINTEGEWR